MNIHQAEPELVVIANIFQITLLQLTLIMNVPIYNVELEIAKEMIMVVLITQPAMDFIVLFAQGVKVLLALLA